MCEICCYTDISMGSYNIQHNNQGKTYKTHMANIHPNKVEYSTATGMYWTTHNVNVSFFITELYSRNIIKHQLLFDNKDINTGILYNMITCQDLIVQLGTWEDGWF